MKTASVLTTIGAAGLVLVTATVANAQPAYLPYPAPQPYYAQPQPYYPQPSYYAQPHQHYYAQPTYTAPQYAPQPRQNSPLVQGYARASQWRDQQVIQYGGQYYGVPQPVRDYAIEHNRRNWEAAERERNAVYANIRGTTGISPTDIERHGWTGGRNSEINKAKRFLGL